jgi:nucleoside-diphosphate-sugar epimerase
MEFVQDNVVATCNILDYARKNGCKFLQFSTDEVFGPAPEGVRYKEWDRYKSGNPYAATKAGAEELALSYHNTYGLPVIITHTMNVVGTYQHPEKYVPSTIRKVRDGDVVTIHSDKTKTVPGSRFYIGAESVADAVMFLLEKGEAGEKYNIVGEREIDNLSLARLISGFVGKPLHYELTESWDHVVTSSCFEHVEFWEPALRNSWGVLKTGGKFLFEVPDLGKGFHGYPHDYWRWDIDLLKEMFKDQEIISIAKTWEHGAGAIVIKRCELSYPAPHVLPPKKEKKKKR